jgi:hypothetical protein
LIFAETFPPNPKHWRDAVDDFYESFYPLPYLHVLGGADWVLPRAKQHWEALTRQLTRVGMLRDEFDRGYDWFHQGEGLLFFYGLCLASPEDAAFRARARRFADLYADGPNYDRELNIIRAPHNGSDGPRFGFYQPGEPVFVWRGSMEAYGLPLEGVPGIETFQALKDPAVTRRMAEAMNERFGQGDVAINLAVVALVANAFLLDPDPALREWILRYAGGWADRARANGGLLPDNVGPGGRDHWPECYTMLFAGAGIEGGRVLGESDEQGAYPTSPAYHPRNMLVTVYRAMGLDVDRTLREAGIVDQDPAIPGLFGNAG